MVKTLIVSYNDVGTGLLLVGVKKLGKDAEIVNAFTGDTARAIFVDLSGLVPKGKLGDEKDTQVSV